MTGQQAMRRAITMSGKSKRALSIDIGRAPTFISQTIWQGARPTSETLALIGRACGYRLALIPQECDLPAGALEIEPE